MLALALINSVSEYVIDHLHPAQADEIGHAKDAAAGAVLVASIAAVAVRNSVRGRIGLIRAVRGFLPELRERVTFGLEANSR